MRVILNDRHVNKIVENDRKSFSLSNQNSNSKGNRRHVAAKLLIFFRRRKIIVVRKVETIISS